VYFREISVVSEEHIAFIKRQKNKPREKQAKAGEKQSKNEGNIFLRNVWLSPKY
jgi:hypothetical protein